MKKLVLTLILCLMSSIAYCAPATMYVTVAGDGDKSGSSWSNAMGLAEWITDATVNAEPGDIYYVAGGTYNLTGNFNSTLDGTADLPIKIIGVNSGTTNEPPVISDWAYSTNRPLITMTGGDYDFVFDNYWCIRNISLQTTDGVGLAVDDNSNLDNCKSVNSSATANRYAISTTGTGVVVTRCEASSTNGYGIEGGTGWVIDSCYVHDSSIGIPDWGNDCRIINTIIDTCTTGITCGTGRLRGNIIGNVIYNCTTGVSGSNHIAITAINNIITGCTTGASWTSEYKINFWDYNIWNNTSDVSNVTKGLNSITANPSLTDPANGDFTVGSTSNAINSAMQMSTNTGVVGAYKVNIGVDQDDNASSGGGASIGWVAIQ